MTDPITQLEADRRAIDSAYRVLIAAQKASTKASEARSRLPAGSSRPKVTTANARWMRAAEHRDGCAVALASALRAGLMSTGPLGVLR